MKIPKMNYEDFMPKSNPNAVFCVNMKTYNYLMNNRRHIMEQNKVENLKHITPKENAIAFCKKYSREEFLHMVKRDGVEPGIISKQTLTIWKSLRVSNDAVDRALWEGKQIRDEIYKKTGYWEIADLEDKARQKIMRHLSCGFRLDDEEAQELIKNLHEAKDNKEFLALETEKKLQIWLDNHLTPEEK